MFIWFLSAFSGGLFFYFLCFPAEGFTAAAEGLLLWYRSLVPTLFPMMILSGLLLKTGAAGKISRIISRPLQKFIPLSADSFYALFIGFLCGCPMGAKTLSDLSDSNTVSQNERLLLAAAINNISPAFLSNYLVAQHMGDTALQRPTLLILYGAPVIYAFFSLPAFLKKMQTEKLTKNVSCSQTKNKTSPTGLQFSVVDVCISDGVSNITKLGGYIVLFSILASIIEHLPIQAPLPKALLLGMTEVSVGIHAVAALPLTFSVKYLLLITISAFGGFCCAAQSAQFLKNAGVPVHIYLRDKLFITLIALLLAAIFVC